METKAKTWSKIPPKKGNHIRVNRVLYYHHGVYISDNEVIHFTGKDADNILDFKNNTVIKTDLDRFLMGGELEVKIYSEDEWQDLYPVEYIVQYARACLGDKGYNLVFNNCEHFANICTLGRYRSKQVEKVFTSIIGGNKMGLMSIFKTVGNGLKNLVTGGSSSSSNSSGGSRSVSSTNYNPDKVKIAELEKEKALALKDKEIEKINTKKEAELEIMRANEDMHLAIEEAKAKGMLLTAEAITRLQQNLNQLAEDSFKVIEGASLEVVKEIENFYSSLEEKIKKDDMEYYKNKFPLLNEQLEKIGEDSPMYETFKKKIDQDISAHISRNNELILNVGKRRNKLIESHIESKNKMIESTAKITEKLTTKYSNDNYLVYASLKNKDASVTENRIDFDKKNMISN